MRRLLVRLLGVLAAGVLVCWRATLRVRVENDPRLGLRAAGRRYVYAILHAQQLSFILERTWDLTQFPRPFSTLTGRFRPPIDPRDFDDPASLRARVAAELLALEQVFDPAEAFHAGRVPATARATRERSP